MGHVNIRQAQKGLTVTNTVAYYGTAKIMSVNILIVQSPEVLNFKKDE